MPAWARQAAFPHGQFPARAKLRMRRSSGSPRCRTPAGPSPSKDAYSIESGSKVDRSATVLLTGSPSAVSPRSRSWMNPVTGTSTTCPPGGLKPLRRQKDAPEPGDRWPERRFGQDVGDRDHPEIDADRVRGREGGPFGQGGEAQRRVRDVIFGELDGAAQLFAERGRAVERRRDGEVEDGAPRGGTADAQAGLGRGREGIVDEGDVLGSGEDLDQRVGVDARQGFQPHERRTELEADAGDLRAQADAAREVGRVGPGDDQRRVDRYHERVARVGIPDGLADLFRGRRLRTATRAPGAGPCRPRSPSSR